MLKRNDNWHGDLHAYLQPHTHAPKPFQYGELDCCLFVTGAIEAMTGVDLAAPFRGTYDDQRSALKAIFDYCGSVSLLALAEKIAADHDLQAIPPGFAQRGDVVIAPAGDSGELALLIVGMTGAELLGVGGSGLIRLPLHDPEGKLYAQRAWAIGVRACPVPVPAPVKL